MVIGGREELIGIDTSPVVFLSVGFLVKKIGINSEKCIEYGK